MYVSCESLEQWDTFCYLDTFQDMHSQCFSFSVLFSTVRFLALSRIYEKIRNVRNTNKYLNYYSLIVNV